MQADVDPRVLGLGATELDALGRTSAMFAVNDSMAVDREENAVATDQGHIRWLNASVWELAPRRDGQNAQSRVLLVDERIGVPLVGDDRFGQPHIRTQEGFGQRQVGVVKASARTRRIR